MIKTKMKIKKLGMKILKLGVKSHAYDFNSRSRMSYPSQGFQDLFHEKGDNLEFFCYSP